MHHAANAFDRLSPHILCVDTDPKGSRVLAKVVGFSGHAASYASSVEEAMDMLHRETIDVVVVRRPVPTLRGVGLTRLLRAEGLMTPVLVLSGDTASPQGFEASADVAGQYELQAVDLSALDWAIRHVLVEGRQPRFDRAAPALARPHAADTAERVRVMLDTLNVEEAERRLIAEALARCAYNRTAAAALLGMHVRTLRRKLKAMRLSALPEQRGEGEMRETA